MIIFIHEERAYLSWLARHRQGFVLDWLQKPTRKPPVLHRATCAEIRRATTKQTHWTTGRHLKACSLEIEELRNWLEHESSKELQLCNECHPAESQPGGDSSSEAAGHLTPLGKEILDYVLEVAVMCLDGVTPGYAVSVADVAQVLGKTAPQITSALHRLLADEYLTSNTPLEPDRPVPENQALYPTVKAMRTMPAFQKIGAAAIRVELKRLTN